MNRPVLRVALTGGIATGKSHCLRTFARMGVPVIDADVVARDVVRRGTPGFLAVIQRFGPEVVDANGELDRRALGRLVFSDTAARTDLEAIIHPAVYGRIFDWFAAEALQRSGRGRHVAIADIPLLFETGNSAHFDAVVVAACSPEEALKRVIARDGLTAAEASQRMASQWPIETKSRLADFVIDTSGSLADTERQVADVLTQLRKRV